MQESRTSYLGTWEPEAGGTREHRYPPPAPGPADSLLLLPAPAQLKMGAGPAGVPQGRDGVRRWRHVCGRGNARCNPSGGFTKTPPLRGTSSPGWQRGWVLLPKLTLLLSSLGNKSVHGGDPDGKTQGSHHTNATRTRRDVAGGSACNCRQHPGTLPAFPPPQRHQSSTLGCCRQLRCCLTPRCR